MYNVESLNKFLNTLATDKIRFESFHDASRNGITLGFIAQEYVDYMKLGRSSSAGIDALYDLKDTILQSKLFDDVRNDLAKYEKLKDMQFVLQEINKLDSKLLISKVEQSEQLSVL